MIWSKNTNLQQQTQNPAKGTINAMTIPQIAIVATPMYCNKISGQCFLRISGICSFGVSVRTVWFRLGGRTSRLWMRSRKVWVMVYTCCMPRALNLKLRIYILNFFFSENKIFHFWQNNFPSSKLKICLIRGLDIE